jgi:hypothetical protein
LASLKTVQGCPYYDDSGIAQRGHVATGAGIWVFAQEIPVTVVVYGKFFVRLALAFGHFSLCYAQN